MSPNLAIVRTRQITCPFCFMSFPARDVAFLCANGQCSARAAGKAPSPGEPGIPAGHIFHAPSGGWRNFLSPIRAVRCDSCGKETTKRLCIHCSFELTHDAGLLDERIIAIIGARATGKSHYIAALVHKLEHEVGANFKWSLRMVGDPTRRRFEQDFQTPLFQRKTVLAATHSAATNTAVKTPMVFRLTFGHGRRRGAINLSFFDTAGEDMDSLDSMSVETRYITRASGLVFLLDPLQIPAVRDRLPGADLPPYSQASEPAYLIDRLRDLFESQGVVKPTERIAIPVAFAVSKIDALYPLMDPGSLLRRSGEHFGGLVRRGEIRSIHTEVGAYLENWIGTGLNQRIETGFARFRYFGVSALGRAPDRSGRLETVTPLRVEDPFLWLLLELGLVRGD